MKQPVYDVVDKLFRSFVVNNQNKLNSMKDDTVKPLPFFFACIPDMKTFEVEHIAKYDGGEGPMYAFLTGSFEKLYTYYDVE